MRKHYRPRRLRFLLTIIVTIILICYITIKICDILIKDDTDEPPVQESLSKLTKNSIQIDNINIKQTTTTQTKFQYYVHRKRTAPPRVKITFPNRIANYSEVKSDEVSTFAYINQNMHRLPNVYPKVHKGNVSHLCHSPTKHLVFIVVHSDVENFRWESYFIFCKNSFFNVFTHTF
jgi:hypothetical protein